MNELNIIENKVELLQEEIECVSKYLDSISIPRKDANGETYSIVGRIKYLQVNPIILENKCECGKVIDVYNFGGKYYCFNCKSPL